MTFKGFEPIAEHAAGHSEGIADAVAALANVRQPLALVDLAAERIVAANAEAAELSNASPSARAPTSSRSESTTNCRRGVTNVTSRYRLRPIYVRVARSA